MAITRATNLAGLGTVFDSLTDGGGLSISGISTFTDLNVTRVNVTGVSTFATLNITNSNPTQLNVTGVTTTTSLVSTAASITTGGLVAGIATVNNINSTHLNIAGLGTFSSGPVLIGTVSPTGTASQPLQVTGGAYINGTVGIGTTLGFTDYSNALTIKASSTDLASVFFWSNRSVSTNHGALFFYNQQREQVSSILGGGSTTGSQYINFGFRGSENTSIRDSGLILGENVGSISSTGTANQRLQVTGGAYVSDYVAIGITARSNIFYILQGVGSTSALYNPNSTNAGAPLVYFRNDDTTVGTDATIRLDANGGGTTAATTISAISESTGNSSLAFGTRASSGQIVEKVRITSGGKVGIGTTIVTYGLEVNNGGLGIRGNISTITFPDTLNLETVNGATAQNYIGWGTNAISRISGFSAGIETGGFLAFMPGGSEAVRLVRNSITPEDLRVGIGTTNPVSNARLQIGPATSSNVVVLTSIGGSFGIGTTNPNQKLTVVGGIRSVVGSQGDITISHSAATFPILVTSALTASGVDFALGTNNTEMVRITSNGVGIGTTGTTCRLQVHSKNVDVAKFYRDTADGGCIRIGSQRGTFASPTKLNSGDYGGIVHFDAHDGTSFLPAVSIVGALNAAPSLNNVQGRLSVFCNPGSTETAYNEVVRVTHAANVGIGTNTLESISANVATVTLGSKVTTTSGGIAYQTLGGTIRGYHYWDSHRLIHDSRMHEFWAGGSPKAVINNSGDAVIGTGATSDFSSSRYPLLVSTSNLNSPTDPSYGGLYSYNGGTFNTVHLGGGSDNDAGASCVVIMASTTTPYPFGGLVVVGGNSTSATNQRVSLYLVKGEVVTTGGVAAVQNTTVTAVAGDTASTSVSITGNSLSSGACAVKFAWSSGSGTNQNFGFVAMGNYATIFRSVRQP